MSLPTSIAPLRMKNRDGSIYRRPKKIEAAILTISQLPADEVANLCKINDADCDEYVPTECLLHFVRNATFAADEHAAFVLFSTLLDRVSRAAVPELTRFEARSDHSPQGMIPLEVREAIIEKFEDMLCTDQNEYDTRLDFYECRFNAALAKLRLTARRDVGTRHAGFENLNADEESIEPSIEVEEAFAKLKEPTTEDSSDPNYRLKLRAAINTLPAKERQIIELLFEGLPIESQDDQVLSVVKVAGCTEKTARNRRDRAILRLQETLKDDSQ
jgi:hypothetical protein